MKKQILIVGLVTLTTIISAQTWGGSITQTGNAFRTGYVGIGMSNPSFALDIEANQINGGIQINNPGNTASCIWFKNQQLNSAGSWILGSAGSANLQEGAGTFFLYDLVNYKDRFLIKQSTGRVAIGTSDPSDQLHIATNSVNEAGITITQNYNADCALTLHNAAYNKTFSLRTIGAGTGNGDFTIYDNNNYVSRFLIKGTTGNVLIGTHPSNAHPDAKLAVQGKIVCKDFYVTAAGDWADFVFEKNYKLPNLNDIKAYYTANKHLPGVPAAIEIAETGINLGEMSKIQMQKIEELTIYMVQLKEEFELLKKENELLKSKIK